MGTRPNWAQILAVVMAAVGIAITIYTSLIAPRMEVNIAREAPQQAISLQNPFHALKPKRTPSDAEVTQAVEMIRHLSGADRVSVVGDPVIVALHAPESEQLVIAYDVTVGSANSSALEVFDLSSTPPKSIFHRKGEEFQYHTVSVEEENKAKTYLLVEEWTGATGNFLHLSFLEYDGFGKMKEFYALQDLSAAFLYPLQDLLVLEQNHTYSEVVKEQAIVRLIDYDMNGRLGFHVLRYGFQNGAWYMKHNEKALPSTDKRLFLTLGDEIFLVSNVRNKEFFVRTLIDGESLEYIKGPPVHIIATKPGEGNILFMSNADNIPEYTLPVQVVSAEK